MIIDDLPLGYGYYYFYAFLVFDLSVLLNFGIGTTYESYGSSFFCISGLNYLRSISANYPLIPN